MAETTAEEYFPHDTFHTQWFLFWIGVVVAGVLLWLSFFKPTPVTTSPLPAISAGYDWFLVLRFPEIPKNPAKAAMLKMRFGSWLTALVGAGYHPMLLSDVERRVRKGTGLPSRAVVVVFDPGYNQTYEELSATLVDHRIPAVWVTDRTALLRGDRHFIHRHRAKWMVRSGFWDLGYSGDGFWRRSTDSSQFVINESQPGSWIKGTGRVALNWVTSLPRLNRLDVSPKWTAEELLTRLDMELPLEGTVQLGIKKVQGHLWGVILPSPDSKTGFFYQASLSGTSSNLYWLGTRGVSDMQLDVAIPSFFGQVSFWLRSDYRAGRGVGISWTRDHIYVDQKINGQTRRLVSQIWTPPSDGIRGRLTLTGTKVSVAMRGLHPSSWTSRPSRLHPTV